MFTMIISVGAVLLFLVFSTSQLSGLIAPSIVRGKNHGFRNRLYIKLSTSPQLFDICMSNHMSQGASVNGPRANRAFQLINRSVVLLGVFLICVKGSNIAQKVQKGRYKVRMPLYWSTATLASVLTWYILTKYIISHCPPPRNGYSMVNCLGVVLAVILFISLCGMAATVHSKHLNLPHPTICGIFRCCGRKGHKVLTTLSLWSIYCSILCLLYSAPYQVLMVCANPHMYGLAIITAWCVMIRFIMTTAIPFTIDQIFLANKDFRITPTQALQQVLFLCFVTLLVLGLGSLTFSLTLLLHVSKYGERTISVMVALFFLVKHVLIPIVSYFLRKTTKVAHKTSMKIISRNEEQ